MKSALLRMIKQEYRATRETTQTPMCSVALPSLKFGIIAVKKLLATTNRPIKTISVSCGYTDLAYLKTLFKRRFGLTMRDYRAQHKS